MNIELEVFRRGALTIVGWNDRPTSIGLFCHSSSCANLSVKSANQLAKGRKLGQARLAQVAGTLQEKRIQSQGAVGGVS